MERAFGRKDCKSRKFWWIDYDGCDFMVNDGKCGSVGKFMVTEFASDDECAKDTESMIRSKVVRFITRRGIRRHRSPMMKVMHTA